MTKIIIIISFVLFVLGQTFAQKDLILAGPIFTDTKFEYEATNNISSLQIIWGMGNVEYKAGSQITLYPGFYAANGCNFHAYIGSSNARLLTKDGELPAYEDQSEILNRGERENLEVENFRCYPNPFSSRSMIEYILPQDCSVTLTISDLSGRMVKELVNASQLKGKHMITIDAQGLPGGMYFANLQADGISKTIKLMVLNP